MQRKDLVKQIKKVSWENRVQRPGFLQSKLCAAESLNVGVRLTKGISIHDPNNLWVKNSALYSTHTYDLLVRELFLKAFQKNKLWPTEVLKKLEKTAQQVKLFIKVLQSTAWPKATKNKKISVFKRYTHLLKEVARHYVIAVPLTNFCEAELNAQSANFLPYAVQYKSLDVDKMTLSLLKIKGALNHKNTSLAKKLIHKHITSYAWIKSNYNIYEPYTQKDMEDELQNVTPPLPHLKAPSNKYKYLITGLQCGIYLRNRMKELSQQLWLAFEPLANSMAKDLNLSREDFLQLAHFEVLKSYSKNKVVVTNKEISLRHKGFVTGIVQGKSFVLTGSEVEKLYTYFNKPEIKASQHLTGMVACKGFVKGTARIVHTAAQLQKLKSGDILITSMTTPDFVVAMKRAGAIVTDEGGLSCHAAIVSRELGIPCIIGTKIATKVFKDGDVVEVDANKGIIRKIK